MKESTHRESWEIFGFKELNVIMGYLSHGSYSSPEELADALKDLALSVSMGIPDPEEGMDVQILASAPIPDLGVCCFCDRHKRGQSLVTLTFTAPVPGTGWGCTTCNLPADGAVAAHNAACEEAPQLGPPKRIINGYIGQRQRIDFNDYQHQPFDHDPKAHELLEG